MLSRFVEISRKDGISEALAGVKRFYEDEISLDEKIRIKLFLLRNGAVVQKDIHGSQMQVDIRQKGVHADLALNGTREKYSIKHYEKRLKELGKRYNDVVILDIGANIGHLALLAAKQIPHARVHAFEPDPRNKDWLEKNISLNKYGNIETSNFAFGSEQGTSTLQIHKESNLSKMTSVSTDHQNIEKTVEVDVTTIDQALENIETGPDTLVVLRMDTEEYEYEILKGATQLLQSNNPIYTFIELHYRHVPLKDLEQFISRFEQNGLFVEQIRDGLGRRKEPVGSDWSDFHNVINNGLGYPWRFDEVSSGLTHLFAYRE